MLSCVQFFFQQLFLGWHHYEVLMVSLGLTMFISTLYGHIFSSWDSSLSMRPWETVAEDDVPEMSNMQGGKLRS